MSKHAENAEHAQDNCKNALEYHVIFHICRVVFETHEPLVKQAKEQYDLSGDCVGLTVSVEVDSADHQKKAHYVRN